MRYGSCILLLLLGATLCVGFSGCRPPSDQEEAGAPTDAVLAPYQGELLDIAFETASTIPANPHIKDRSRAQEAVVTACLELEQPQRAVRYIEQIDNWRRGAAYADLAFYCARHGVTCAVEHHVNLAAQIAQEAEDWRRDRIQTKIAQVYAYMGQTQTAAQFEQDVAPSESGKVARVEAMLCPGDAFDERMEAVATLVSTGQFDLTRNALAAYAEMYDRFYADIQRRTLVEQKIKASWSSMPIVVRVELLAELAGFSLGHADQVKTLELVNEARKMMDSARWQARFAIPLMARLVALRFRAGDEEYARAEARETLALFDTKRDEIVNIYWAETLRSVAQAYHTMGDGTGALDLYKRAIEAGIENPNSRPRAEDLAATCCSMALHAVKPGPELLSRIREIRDGLGDPW